MNAFTTKEHTAFYVRLLAGSVDLGLDILSEIIWAPPCAPMSSKPSARSSWTKS